MPAVLALRPGRLRSAFAEHPEEGGRKLSEVKGGGAPPQGTDPLKVNFTFAWRRLICTDSHLEAL